MELNVERAVRKMVGQDVLSKNALFVKEHVMIMFNCFKHCIAKAEQIK
jgi:hypothetical protein